MRQRCVLACGSLTRHENTSTRLPRRFIILAGDIERGRLRLQLVRHCTKPRPRLVVAEVVCKPADTCRPRVQFSSGLLVKWRHDVPTVWSGGVPTLSAAGILTEWAGDRRMQRAIRSVVHCVFGTERAPVRLSHRDLAAVTAIW